jgi:hypothetical protein
MKRSGMPMTFQREIVLTLLLFAGTSAARAQQPAPTEEPSGQPAPAAAPDASRKLDEPTPQAKIKLVQPVHRFWDRENDWLFAGVGAGRALDYASTLNLRRRGIDEVFLTNSIVDNHALFAGIEVGATAASIGVSYLFHRTGHHRLERWTSAIHAGIGIGGAIRNYSLKTPHPI